MINGVDISDPTRSFKATEWNILGSNGGRAYIAQAWDCMNGRGRGGRDGVREYGRGSGPRNANELNVNNGGGNDELQHE